MAIRSLYDNHIAGLYALARGIAEYSLAGILEADFKEVLILLLIHSLKPVIDLQLTASLSICTFQLTGFLSFHDTTTGTVVSL
jgi:hypothetical protein